MPRHHRRRPVFVQFALIWGRKWAAQSHLARAVGKRFRGCRAKRLYADRYRVFKKLAGACGMPVPVPMPISDGLGAAYGKMALRVGRVVAWA